MKIISRLQNGWAGLKAGLGVQVTDWDDYWFAPRGYHTASGARVSPETAMRLAAVFACVRVISETIGSLPLVIYRRRSDGGKERADDHPLAPVLRKPNTWQTSFEFWEMMQAHLELRGNAFSKIVSGNGRAIDQLIPIHPDRVRVFRLDNGKLRYEVVSYFDASIERLTQEEVFHLRGLSSDGIVGMSTISAGAEVVGVGLAQQEHRARYFGNGAVPGLYLKPAQKLDKEARENLSDTIKKGFSGANAFKALVGQPGMDITQLGLTNKDSQLIEAGQATRTDIASMFRLPPHKIGDLTRGTFSNIEEQNIEFATDSIRPRAERIERRLDIDLLDPLSDGTGNNPGQFFAAFDMDALLRGDLKSRYEAYQLSVGGPWMAMNEARASEGKNPVDGGDDILRPVNMAPVNEPPDTADNTDTQDNLDNAGAPPAEPVDENAKSPTVKLAQAAANRIVRREVKALREAEGDVREFANVYRKLVPIVSENLVIPAHIANRYCNLHLGHVVSADANELARRIEEIEASGACELINLCLAELGKEVRSQA